MSDLTLSDWMVVTQTVAIVLGVIVAGFTIKAMSRQTVLAAKLAHDSQRRACLEQLLAASTHRRWPQSGRSFYQALNVVPALFALDAAVLDAFRKLRDEAVHRDPARGGEAYTRLLLAMAKSSGLPLTEADINAVFAPQWDPDGA